MQPLTQLPEAARGTVSTRSSRKKEATFAPSPSPSTSSLVALWTDAYTDYETWLFLLRGTTASRRALLAAYYPGYAHSFLRKRGYRCYARACPDEAGSADPALACSLVAQQLESSPPSGLGWVFHAARREVVTTVEMVCLSWRLGARLALQMRLYSRGGKRLQRRLISARAMLLGARDSAAAPLWRVDMVATAPRWRRRGLMTAMLTELLRDADAANADVVLSTSSLRNRTAYERAGFVAVEASRVSVGDGTRRCSARVVGGDEATAIGSDSLETTLLVRCHGDRPAHATVAAIVEELARQRRNAEARGTLDVSLIFVLVLAVGAALLQLHFTVSGHGLLKRSTH